MNLDSKKARVRYLAESVEDIPKDPDRGRMLMILLYWKVFDGVDIPDSLMKQLMQKATNPETLGRLARFVNNDILAENLEEKRKEYED